MSDEPKVCDICGLPVRKGEHVTDGPPPCHTLHGLCIRRLKEEVDRLRSVVAVAREWVRRNAAAEAAEEEGLIDGDNTMDVGGERRDASDWVYEAWDALRGALDDTTRDAWADRQAAICRAAERLAKADAAFAGDAPYEATEEEYDRALGALVAAVKEGR